MNLMAPFAEDLLVGSSIRPAPDITVDEGMAAQYLAITGDQLRMALSDPLSYQVTGKTRRMANPALVISLSIGQSTVATGRVIANLSYHNLILTRPVHLGESLRTTVTPLAASWTKTGRDRAKVLLGMSLATAEGEPLASYQRLALLPVRDPGRMVVTDELAPKSVLALHEQLRTIPSDWVSPRITHVLRPGDRVDDPLPDTVSSARELVRLTQNQAAVHRDARAGTAGRRLVYGGHTVGLAQASLSRMLPDLLTVAGWRSCSHTGPVFENDLLTFALTVDAVEAQGDFRLVDATVYAVAHRGGQDPVPVLQWSPILVLAGRLA